MDDDQTACMDVARALALLAAAARGGVDLEIPGTGTHGVAALVGAIILMARASKHAPEVIDVAIDALRLAQRTIRADRSPRRRMGS